MNEKELFNALKMLLTPLIKEVVLSTIDEYQQEHQKKPVEYAQVTADEAAKQLNVTKVTLWRWEQSGYLKPVHIGVRVFYRQSDIDKLRT